VPAPKNPYEPPALDDEPVATAPASGDHVVASKGQRFANALIDQTVIFFVSLLLGLALADDDLAFSIVSYFLMFGYYVAFEATIGSTPGKLITKTKVVSVSGGPPSFSQILGRSLVRFVPFDALSYLGRTDSGWHDRWSSTRVVRVGETAPREERKRRPRAPTKPRVVRSKSDPSRRRVVCGVCGRKFAYGASSCPECETRYQYVAGRPVIADDDPLDSSARRR
jgi:uncharacterized RDD family membrane protein YckC